MEKLHMQPSELDRLPYYEYEYTVSLYNDMLKDRKNNEDNLYDKERDKYNVNDLKNQSTRGIKMPSLGNSSSIKIPKF